MPDAFLYIKGILYAREFVARLPHEIVVFANVPMSISVFTDTPVIFDTSDQSRMVFKQVHGPPYGEPYGEPYGGPYGGPYGHYSADGHYSAYATGRVNIRHWEVHQR